MDVPGTTVLDVAGGAVRAAREYTDRQALLEQLGLQVVVQPPALGPLTFGTGLRVHHGQTARPGALSLNVLDFGPEGEPGGTLQALGQPVVEELASTAGFLGLTIAGFGARGCLLAAWEGPEHPRQLLRSPAHAEAVRRFSQPDFVASEMSSVWTPVYLRWRVRCPACGRKSDPERAAGVCPCGPAPAATTPLPVTGSVAAARALGARPPPVPAPQRGRAARGRLGVLVPGGGPRGRDARAALGTHRARGLHPPLGPRPRIRTARDRSAVGIAPAAFSTSTSGSPPERPGFCTPHLAHRRPDRRQRPGGRRDAPAGAERRRYAGTARWGTTSSASRRRDAGTSSGPTTK